MTTPDDEAGGRVSETNRWTEVWAVGGLDIPLPPSRSDETSSGEAGRWEKTFRSPACEDGVQLARFYDRWAEAAGLRLASEGPFPGGTGPLMRSYVLEGGGGHVWVSGGGRWMGIPTGVKLVVLVRSALPRTACKGGRLEAFGFSVPLPPGAQPDAHDDQTSYGLSDVHHFVVPGCTSPEATDLYVTWAATQGFELRDQVEGLGDCHLFFRHTARQLAFDVCLETSDGAPILALSFRALDDGA